MSGCKQTGQKLGDKVAPVNQRALFWCVLNNAAEDWSVIIFESMNCVTDGSG